MLRRFCLAGMLILATGAVPAAASDPEAPPAMEEKVYLTVPEALRETFPKAERFEERSLAVPDSVKARLEASLGGPVAEDTVIVHTAVAADGAVLGHAVVSEEVGKYRPITFMVGTTPDLRVERVTILVYRESHGGEVRRDRFLNQYRGKTAASPLRRNQDIINISGATLSVRALNFGVRKVLGLLDALMTAPVEGSSP